MPYQRIKFYQTGSFAVGNRLLAEDQRSVQSTAGRSNALTCGHRACRGCGEALGARYALDAVMRATKGKLIAVNATGCLEVFSTPFPETSWQIAWLHSLFGNAPAVATGVAAALKAMGRGDIRVVGQGGDGGTVDIGMACLSGMFERNDDVLYICYDNQAYMNTGVQRSGATPPAARTATTPAEGPEPGNTFGQGKNVPLIAMAHEIPYVATATVADLRDLEYKATRAMDFHGARYLHILVPCPLGWGSSRTSGCLGARKGIHLPSRERSILTWAICSLTTPFWLTSTSTTRETPPISGMDLPIPLSIELSRRSLKAPGARVPTFPSRRRTCAAMVVAERMISIGRITSRRLCWRRWCCRAGVQTVVCCGTRWYSFLSRIR